MERYIFTIKTIIPSYLNSDDGETVIKKGTKYKCFIDTKTFEIKAINRKQNYLIFKHLSDLGYYSDIYRISKVAKDLDRLKIENFLIKIFTDQFDTTDQFNQVAENF